MVISAARIVFQRVFLSTQEGHFVAVRLAVKQAKETVSIVDTALPERRAIRFLKEVGIKENEADAPLTDAVLRFGVRRIEDDVRSGADLPATYFITIEDSDLPLLAELVSIKSCGYQHEEGKDIYCSVAGDHNAVAVGVRSLAPTSLALCNACNLPATDYLCSHLHHPKVSVVTRYKEVKPDGQGGLIRTGPAIVREVQSALCDLAKPEIGQPTKCRPGQNGCWERAVVADIEEPTDFVPALALPEALDFLDAAWQVAFDRHLFRTRSFATDATLALDSRTPAEFDARLSKIDEVLNAITIGNDQLADASEPIEKGQTLTRMLTLLKATLPPEVHEETERAVGILRAIKTIRAVAQHPERRAELLAAYAKLRLPPPPQNPTDTWRGIRARAIEAVGTIRDGVRGLAPYRERHQRGAAKTDAGRTAAP